MKTKTSIYRRHFAYILLLVFCGCESKNVKIEDTTTTINGREMKSYTIDSCEYIGAIFGNSSDVLTHKGNCKYCIERSKNR